MNVTFAIENDEVTIQAVLEQQAKSDETLEPVVETAMPASSAA
jgi:hypothetical protein